MFRSGGHESGHGILCGVPFGWGGWADLSPALNAMAKVQLGRRGANQRRKAAQVAKQGPVAGRGGQGAAGDAEEAHAGFARRIVVVDSVADHRGLVRSHALGLHDRAQVGGLRSLGTQHAGEGAGTVAALDDLPQRPGRRRAVDVESEAGGPQGRQRGGGAPAGRASEDPLGTTGAVRLDQRARLAVGADARRELREDCMAIAGRRGENGLHDGPAIRVAGRDLQHGVTLDPVGMDQRSVEIESDTADHRRSLAEVDGVSIRL